MPTSSSESSHYSKPEIRNLKLLFFFFCRLQKKVLRKTYSKIQTKKYMHAIKQAFREVIPRIPYIGGKSNTYSKFMTMAAMCVPIAKILKNDGIPTRDIGKILIESSDLAYDLIQKPFKNRMTKEVFSQQVKQQNKQDAHRSQQSQYPFDWKLEYSDGDDETSQDYKVTMSECGIVKFFKQENLEEIAPYLCLTDFIPWDNSNIRVTRSQTLANGGSVCDYHYLGLGSNGYRGWPPEEAEEWSGQFEDNPNPK